MVQHAPAVRIRLLPPSALRDLPETAPLFNDSGQPLQPLLKELRQHGGQRMVLCNCCYPPDSGQYRIAALCPEKLLLGMSAAAAFARADGLALAVMEPDLGNVLRAAAAGLELEAELHVLEPALCLADPGALFQRAAGGAPMVPCAPATDFLGRPALCASPLVWCRVYAAVSGHGEWCGHACLSLHSPQRPHALFEVTPQTTWRDLVAAQELPDCAAVLWGGPAGLLFSGEQLSAPVLEQVEAAASPIYDWSAALLPGELCPVAFLRDWMERAHRGSCGKCVFCRIGTRQLGLIAQAVSMARAAPEELDTLAELAAGMAEGAACPYGRGVGAAVLRWMELFREEFQQHIRRRRCRSLVCPGYITYHILPEKCRGCGACVSVCPDQAIDGSGGEIHVIDSRSCAKCGACRDACPNQAIVTAGPLKPRTPKTPIPVGTWKGR